MKNDKANIIDIYKAFITNKDFPLNTSDRFKYKDKPNPDEGFKFESVNEKFYYHKEHTYYDENVLKTIDKSKYDYKFKEAKHIPNGIREVVLHLSKHPPIKLYEYIEIVSVESEQVGYIKYKGRWGKWFGLGENVTICKRIPRITRYIEFGSIGIDLDKAEFDELYEFYNKHLDVRPNQLDRVRLHNNLREYIKTPRRRP